ncbi:LPXTG-motif cell wall anchor domain-containing protein [Gracilibacillus orientalis]|uniref:LPXTG-motif cell wall anchor domain-containing protein n=1 Tax=Gracilibacillus orientalis TaxID=334253 RepID=A0A1I4NUT4_9BACI|nr:5'-nucleotidase C-terminal domain-containing protein [Gracilibacillus orientalis]SFM19239.1 LPXTG-motif cell wall anchor domain-containing protein [Gracilibacillus orientalis]
MNEHSRIKITSLFLAFLLVFTQLSSAFVPLVEVNAQETEALSVTEALSESHDTEVIMEGYIVAPFNSQYAIKVAEENNQDATSLIVKLETDQRDQFSPELNEAALGQKIIVTGTRDVYSNQESIESVTSIEFVDGDVIEDEDPSELAIEDARQQTTGSVVTIEGVVTSSNLSDPNSDQLSTYIQDETAGINLFAFDETAFPTLNEGDRVKVTGEIDVYNGLIEIIPNDMEVLASGEALPFPTAITLADLNDEAAAEPLEGQLVSVSGYIQSIPSDPAGGGYNISLLDSDFNSTTLRVMEGTLDVTTLEEGNWYDITAVLSQYNSYQILPRKASDLSLAEEQPEAPDAGGEYTSTVEYVSDGDTIRLTTPVLGADRVRFLNIDTPETSVSGANGADEANQKEHGQYATDRLKELLPEGSEVTLKIGEEPTDQYGRLLAEVINEDGINTNMQMVEEGYASTYFIWPIGDETTYQTYQDTVKEAIDNELGIWNPANPLTELPFAYRAITEGGDFHRYVGNSDTKEYVEPTAYEEVPVEKRIFFASVEEAETQGYTAAVEAEEPSDELLEVQILSMNDLHGKIDQEYSLDVDGEEAVYGRMDYTAQAIKEREQENENTLLVHAGDMIGGSSPISGLLQDEPTVEIMNEMGFDVGTVGNHEFDEGLAELKRMVDGGDHPEGLGTEGYEGMNFDVLCANCIQEDTGETYLPPYAIQEVDGVEIGFIGVNTQETMNMVMPSSLENVAFTDETEAVNDATEELQAQGVEAIIVLAHMPATESESSATGAAADMANNVDDAVDIIFAAHNHQVVDTVVDNKLIIQASEYGKAFADVDIQIDRETNDIIDAESEVVFVKQDDYEAEPAVESILNKYESEIESIVNEEIGYNAQELTGQYTNDGDHGLGNLITDGMKWVMDADFAMHNGGGIRDSLTTGPITWGEIFNILPFANSVMSVEIKGKDLIPILNDNLSGYGSDYSVSGLHYTYNHDYQHVVDITLPDGTPIDPEETYVLATNNYIGTQDGPISNLGKNPVMGPVDVDAAVDYMKYLDTTEDNPLEIGPEGRIAQTDEIPDIDDESYMVGYNAQDLVGDYTNGIDHGLGNLITDSMKFEMDSDFAVTNGGGIGSSLLAGEITTSSLEQILTHGNTLVKMEVTGAELEEILNAQLSQNGSDYSVAGFHYRYNKAAQKVISITLPNGKKVKKKDTYTLTTNNYLASSGVFASIDSEQEEGPVDVEALENYISSLETTEDNPLVYGSEGRISAVPKVTLPEVVGNKAKVKDVIFDQAAANGKVMIDFTKVENIDESQPLEISLTCSQLAKLKNKNAALSVKKNDVNLDFPAAVFNDEQDTTIIIEKLSDVEGAKSAVYDFTIMEGENVVSDFSETEGVRLAFNIHDENIENPDLLKVFYLNEETGKWEEVGGEYQDGIVTVTTNHFSTFTVLEAEPANDDSNPGDDPGSDEDSDNTDGNNEDGEPNNDDGNSKETDTDNSDGNSSDEEENADEGGDGTNNSDKNKDEEGQENGKGSETSSNNELPNTATSSFNYLLIGLVVLIIGFGIMIQRRKIVK